MMPRFRFRCLNLRRPLVLPTPAYCRKTSAQLPGKTSGPNTFRKLVHFLGTTLFLLYSQIRLIPKYYLYGWFHLELAADTQLSCRKSRMCWKAKIFSLDLSAKDLYIYLRLVCIILKR